MNHQHNDLFPDDFLELGYNKGDRYEDRIYKICSKFGSVVGSRGRASDKADIVINHKDNDIKIECKSHGADYGQKTLDYKDKVWMWNKPDITTDFYDKVGVLDLIPKDFIPKRANHENLPKNNYNQWLRDNITIEDKRHDQKGFERSNIEISNQALIKYYLNKNCYYIQIDGSGLYHFQEDIYSLGTSLFNGRLFLRLRTKTIRSLPVYKYGFYAVLKLKKIPSKSAVSLDPLDQGTFLFD